LDTKYRKSGPGLGFGHEVEEIQPSVRESDLNDDDTVSVSSTCLFRLFGNFSTSIRMDFRGCVGSETK